MIDFFQEWDPVAHRSFARIRFGFMVDLKQHMRDQFKAKLLQIVRRHREAVNDFDLTQSIFDEASGLDSLDLAEVFAWVEQSYGIAPVLSKGWPVSTWGECVELVCQEQQSKPCSKG